MTQPSREIEVVQAGSLDRELFERKYRRASRPFILRGGARDWKAVSSWSPEMLRDRYASRRVGVAMSETGYFRPPIEPDQGSRLEEMSFEQAAGIMMSTDPAAPKCYLMQTSIPDRFPDLLPDVQAPVLIGEPPLETNLWFGGPGCVTPAHYDNLDNFLVQVYGRKRVILYSPSYLGEFYPHPFYTPFLHVSRVNVFQPDFSRFPRFKNVVPLEAILEPGDMLFIPVYWWHTAASLDVSISVNLWWKPRLAQRFVKANLRYPGHYVIRYATFPIGLVLSLFRPRPARAA